MSERLPNRRCQSPYEITSTRGFDGSSSSAVNTAPMTGTARSVAKRLAVVLTIDTRSASPPPVTVADPWVNAARLSTVAG